MMLRKILIAIISLLGWIVLMVSVILALIVLSPIIIPILLWVIIKDPLDIKVKYKKGGSNIIKTK